MDSPRRVDRPNEFSGPVHPLNRAVAEVCPNVPSQPAAMCPNVPPPQRDEGEKCARICPDLPESASAGGEREICRTNPNEPGGASTTGVAEERSQPGSAPPNAARACTGGSTGDIHRETLTSARPLSDAQLAATRLIVRGYGSKMIAKHLGLNHHTIGRWKRDSQFAAEVERLRAEATAAAVASVATSSSARTDRRLPPAATTSNRPTEAPVAGSHVTRAAGLPVDRGADALIGKILGKRYGR